MLTLRYSSLHGPCLRTPPAAPTLWTSQQSTYPFRRHHISLSGSTFQAPCHHHWIYPLAFAFGIAERVRRQRCSCNSWTMPGETRSPGGNAMLRGTGMRSHFPQLRWAGRLHNSLAAGAWQPPPNLPYSCMPQGFRNRLCLLGRSKRADDRWGSCCGSCMPAPSLISRPDLFIWERIRHMSCVLLPAGPSAL